jgi:hypothetical protein
MANQPVKIEGTWKVLRITGWAFAAILLLLPAIAMQFTSEVDWSPSDFVIMGALIGTIGLGTEFLVRRSASTAYRIGAILAMVTAFLTIWVNLAVGMIGEDNPYNLLFFGVLAIALAGAIASNFRAAGMAKAMAVAAVAQAAIASGGLAADPRGALFSMVFAFPWILSAGLFRRAGHDQGTSTVSTASGSVSG